MEEEREREDTVVKLDDKAAPKEAFSTRVGARRPSKRQSARQLRINALIEVVGERSLEL